MARTHSARSYRNNNVPNLDCEPDSELRRIIETCKGYMGEAALAREFGCSHRTLRMLETYARNALLARIARLQGNIDRAVSLETLNESLYQDLPKAARW